MMKTRRSIIDTIYRKQDIEKIDAKMKLLGAELKLSTESFLNIRLFVSALIFIALILFSKNGYFLAPISSFGFYYLFTFLIIDRPLKRRSRKLEHEAFYFFEVLTISLESGRNLETAIEAACTYIKSGISLEFKETLYQIKFGKSLIEALEDMRFRIPSDVINNIILNILQSSSFGNSMLETLYNQLDFLRDKQIMDIKSEISSIPTKISVFSVIFFIPLILLLIIAPLIIEYITNL